MSGFVVGHQDAEVRRRQQPGDHLGGLMQLVQRPPDDIAQLLGLDRFDQVLVDFQPAVAASPGLS